MMMEPAQTKTPDAALAFDPTDPAFLRDPYPRYTALREHDRLHRSDEGAWVLTRHADVLAVLRDTRMSSDPRHRPDVGRVAGRLGRAGADTSAALSAHAGDGDGDGDDGGASGRSTMPFLSGNGPSVMLFLDPPDHTRLRRLANKAFTPRAVERLRPRIGALVDELLDRVAERGEADLMADLAYPLPVIVICELLGVPTEDHERFKAWSTDVARLLDPVVDAGTGQRAMGATLQFVQYFGGLMEERRREPRDDLLTALLQAEEEGDALSQAELMAMVILLFVAGHETTTNLIGNGTLALLRNRDQFALLRDRPDLAQAATEELLRYDAPVQVTARTASVDLEVGGLELARGETVVCGLAAANRDPRFVEDPDELRLERGTPTHVAFGNGIHYCLGAPLARIEGQETFRRLAARFPDLALADEDPPYRDHFVLRGLDRLLVRPAG